MDYGRLKSTESMRSLPDSIQTEPGEQKSNSPRRKRKLILLAFISIVLIVASAISAALLVSRYKNSAGEVSAIRKKPTKAISRTCSKTLYPSLCVNSLLDFPGATTAGENDLVHISVNMTLQRVGKALYGASGYTNLVMSTVVRSAYEDCMELLSESVDQLSKSLTDVSSSSNGNNQAVSSTQDVLTWLSAALTNQDTCSDGFEGLSGTVKDQMEAQLKDLTELVSNCLAIFAGSIDDDDFSGIPIKNRRRKLLESDFPVESGFPVWMTRKERSLLVMPAAAIQADIVVAKDGSGKYKTIAEAIKAAPQGSSRRTIIYVKTGRYEEDTLKVGRKKTNLMFIGDGKGKTVITGGKSVAGGLTTFRTASFAASGTGFIARDITFENHAEPSKHQAVALRISADHAVLYHCSIIGYQDTLYVHSNRQFYRECDIYGTVDFIFGNAAVVFQNCNLYARKPMPSQKITYTAQNRKDPNQNTGISIHNCRILATSDLEASKGSFPTYLGRPWKMYARTVYLLSYMGDHINPRGWLEWSGNFALDTLYYGEYMNSGPGSALGQRVKWPGYRVITSRIEASKFTVGQFIFGSSWLPSTGVAFMAGLNV